MNITPPSSDGRKRFIIMFSTASVQQIPLVWWANSIEKATEGFVAYLEEPGWKIVRFSERGGPEHPFVFRGSGVFGFEIYEG